MKIVFGVVALLALYGCSSIKSSGVQALGKNHYTVTARATCTMELAGSENSAEARQAALSEANEYCSSKGSYINVLEERTNRGECASVIINFSCEK